MRRDYNDLPKEIQEEGMDFHWDNQKMWSLDIPIEEMDVGKLEWQLDLPFWDHAGSKYNLCPRDVLKNIEAYPDHKKRVLNADITHPIDIMENQNGKLEILDGVHRLVRLILEGSEKVKVRNIPREYISLIENDQDSFERVIPTAWMVAYRRTFSDIPFSQEIFNKLEEVRKRNNYKEIPDELKKPELAPQFEARYKLIDDLIYKSGCDQILELASGFSSRGLLTSKDSEFTYVELDLPTVIREKKQIIEEMSRDNDFQVPESLHFVSGNALDLESFKKASKYFDRSKPLVITNEGLLRYLTKEERAKVAQNIHTILKEFDGFWITSDVSLRKIFSKENKVMNDHVEKISKLTGKDIVANRFETEKEARDFFENLGFSIKRHSFMEVHDNLTSPQKLNLSEQQVKELLEDAVVFVMKAI